MNDPVQGIYLGFYPGIDQFCLSIRYLPGVYLLEGFYVLPTRKSAKSHKILRKFEPKWVITLLVKRYIPPKVKTWVNNFLLLALGFYLNPSTPQVGTHA